MNRCRRFPINYPGIASGTAHALHRLVALLDPSGSTGSSGSRGNFALHLVFIQQCVPLFVCLFFFSFSSEMR